MEQKRPEMRLGFGEFVLDPSQASVTRKGKPVPLAPKELELLLVLVRQTGHLISKEDLIRCVWPETFVSDSSLLRNISMLRRQLGHDCIRTVPKRGYIFVLPVQELANPRMPDVPERTYSEAPLDAGDSVPGSEQISVEALDVSSSVGISQRVVDRNRLPVVPRGGIGSAAMAAVLLLLLIGALIRRPHLHAAPGPSRSRPSSAGIAPSRMAGAVSLFVLNQNDDSVSVLDGLTDTVSFRVLMSGNPRGAAISPDGKAVYISLNGVNRVAALDSRTRRIIALIPVGNNPVGIAVNPRPPYLYVANNYSDSVSVIDTRTNSVVRTLRIGSVPTEIGITPDGSRAIVTNQSGGSVTMLDAVANTVLATVPVGSTPVGVAFTPDSRFAWVTLAGEDEVAVLDLVSRRIVHRVSAGHGPLRVVISHDGRYALVSDFFSNFVTVIETRSFRRVKRISVGLNPVGLALDAPGDFAFVANYGSNTVSVIDTRSMTLVDSIVVGKNPVEMAALPCFKISCTSQPIGGISTYREN